MIAVSLYEMEIILSVIKKHVPNCDVLVFGSRYKLTHNDKSDLDLAIVGNSKLNIRLVSAIKEDFMESDLPFKVDVIDYHSISDSFREIIDRSNVRIYPISKN